MQSFIKKKIKNSKKRKMVYRMLIPGIQETNTKDCIISVLSQKYPLTKMKLYNEVKKRGLKVTFHAVNKATNHLVDTKILNKKRKEYLINYEWVTALRKFSEKLTAKLLDDKGCLIHGVKDIKKEGNITTLTFDNILDMDEYCKSLHEHYYSQLDNNEVVCLVYSHHWWHILYPYQEYSVSEANKRFYCLCTNNTKLDKTGSKFKKGMGMNVIYKKDVPFKNVSVYGDVIVQNIMSKELSNAVDDFFKKAKTINDLASPKKFVHNVLKKKGKIIVIVNKNAELAEEIKKSVIYHFKK